MKNVLSIDFEEYYQGILTIPEADYSCYPGRIEANSEHLLRMLAEYSVHATFFVSGHVASRFPDLVRELQTQGHEIACHGYSHGLVRCFSPEQFRDDIHRALESLSNCADTTRITGFRAPWWSLERKHAWAWEVLEELGFRYDSSINPIRMRHYGDPGAPLTPYQIVGTGLWEFPPSALDLFGLRLSAAGGFYWRHYPYPLIRGALKKINHQGRAAVCYFHPWELDISQPRLPGIPLEQRLIHYSGRHGMADKIRRVLTEFEFGPFREVFADELALTASAGTGSAV